MIGFIIVDAENYVNIEHSPETSKLSEHYFDRPICQKASLCVKAITVTIKAFSCCMYMWGHNDYDLKGVEYVLSD